MSLPDLSRFSEETINRLLVQHAQSLNWLAAILHHKNARWWQDPRTGERIERNKGEMIALKHSELSEMLEGVRKDKMDDHLPHRKSEEVELGDLFIRAFDYGGAFRLDLSGAVLEKVWYNEKREDHKPENRLKEGGKQF